MNKTVTFLGSGPGRIPAGGAKVIYEYANGLAERGWRVRVVHPRLLTFGDIRQSRTNPKRRLRDWIGYHRTKMTGSYKPSEWMPIHPDVELIYSKTLEPRSLPASDVWVATYWYTAKWAAVHSGAKIYLIQHLETWAGPEDEVMATWQMPLTKVVISNWLREIAEGLGEKAHYIPNGLNFKAFGVDVAPEERDPHAIAMLFHHSDWKGSRDGLEAICEAKKQIPALKAQLFGVPERPADLPDWIEYFQNPPQHVIRHIYNRAAIFIAPSWTEGWGLPPCEAMQCGAAVIATDIDGHREFAVHNETALLNPARDPAAIVENIRRMTSDHELRLKLAKQGNRHVQQFTWERAITSFEAVLQEALEGAGRKNRVLAAS